MREAFLVNNLSGASLRALNYTPEIEAFRARRGTSVVQLGSLLESMGPAYGAVFVRKDCDSESGIELITQGDMFAAEPSGRVIRIDSMARPERHLVRRHQVLIAGAGTLGETELYGRALIADRRLEGRYVGPHAMVLTFSEPEADDSLFAYAFLCSSVGLRAIRATSFGTKILGLRKDMLRSLPVPFPEPEQRTRVAGLIRACVKSRELYAHELQAARSVIDALPEMQTAHEMCAERKARTVLWSGNLPTLNAWNYASTGGALELLTRKWTTRVSDVVAPNRLFRGGRYQRIPCAAPHGVDFLNQRDVFSIRPVPRRIVKPTVPDDSFYAPAFSLLAGGQGTLGEGELFGQVALVTQDFASMGVTEHLLRIQPAEQADAAVLFAFLSTLVGRRLLRGTGVGTKLLSLRPDLVLALPFPSISALERKRIVAHLLRASAARVEAARAEVEAIRITEEEVIPKWLA